MNGFRIYLSGGISGLSRKEANDWRFEFYRRILEGDSYYGYKYKLDIFNPVIYFHPLEQLHDSEREAMDFDLNHLMKSDLVVVNYNDPSSRGTMAEIAIAYDRRIPILGLSKDWQSLHTWQIEMSDRFFEDMDSLIEYVANFYLT